MSAREKTPDILDEVLAGAKTEKPSKETPKADSNTEMKVMPLRLPVSWKEALKLHFKEKGQNLSNGIRGILAEYMDREGLK